MHIQKSFVDEQVSIDRQGAATGTGVLYLVGTPIGNLEDITVRALRTLREADIIAAEDTRHTRKLLTHFEISTKLVSYHEHNKRQSGERLIAELIQGLSIALVSDAGLPGISDPGYELVVAALERRIRVVPIPGANAALTALIAGGLPCDTFAFVGFLPRDSKRLRNSLKSWAQFPHTMIFYESPHRLKQTLKAMHTEWGNRGVVLARELTKKYEEFARGSIADCLQDVEERGAQGEYCLIVAGYDGSEVHRTTESERPAESALHEAVLQQIADGLTEKEAIKLVALHFGIPKRDVYNQYVRRKVDPPT